ncbi:extracellular solute-binding protein [Paenibacillus frigoriresistens]|uniref:ABC transporter substrate-binding protein n=1 Tax=Paenibacillus alginolyticus TaxID=59839 RepID=UPI001562F096|nr:extracellular solute-binding protein [Paenibacillus frigoriresistens]NRF93778.1 extracellular solute-binding protein [Paenibacillus frigoriresistens]
MRKSLKAILGSALAISLLAGCASNGSGGDASVKKEESGTAAPKEMTLKVFIAQPRFKEQYDKFVADFVAKEKADKNLIVKVQMEMPPVDQAPQILKTRLAANDVPDVFSLHAINELPTYYKAGYVEDLSKEPFASKILDSVKPTVTIDNKVLAVPLETLDWGYLYNKKIFADLGLKPPTTITEMKTVIEALKKNKITPFELAYKEAQWPQLFLPLTVGALANTENKDFIERMNSDKGSFNEIKSQLFSNFDLVNANGTDRAFESSASDGAAAFSQGKAAMWVMGPWYADTILKSNPDMQIGVAPFPISDNPNATMINMSVSTSLAVASASKNKELARDFVNFVLDDKETNDLFKSLKFNPNAKNHTFESFPWIAEALTYVKAGKSYKDPVMPPAVKDEAGKLLQSYYVKQISQDDVISGLDKAWKNANKINKK